MGSAMPVVTTTRTVAPTSVMDAKAVVSTSVIPSSEARPVVRTTRTAAEPSSITKYPAAKTVQPVDAATPGVTRTTVYQPATTSSALAQPPVTSAVAPPSRKPVVQPASESSPVLSEQAAPAAGSVDRGTGLVQVPRLPSDEVPDVVTLYHILWSTMEVISEAQGSGNFAGFTQILSPRMRSEVPSGDLPRIFQGLKPHEDKLGKSVGKEALFELDPYLMSDGRMRLRGLFDVAEGLRFDLLYQNVDGVWYVDAVAFAEKS